MKLYFFVYCGAELPPGSCQKGLDFHAGSSYYTTAIRDRNRPAAGCSWAIDLYHMNTTDRFGIHGNNGHNRVQKVMKSTRKRRKAPLAHGTTFAGPFGS